MFRGYRGVIAAIAGLVLLGATPAPNERASAKATQPSGDVERSLRDIADAQIEQSKASEYEAPCDEGQYNRNSDLCAQWYAAISAGEAARYSFWTFWLGFFSLALSAGGLGALIITIRQGREGLKKADAANKIARQTQVVQLRPWLTLKEFLVQAAEQVSVRGGEVISNTYVIQIEWHNRGATPATKIRTSLKYRLIGEDEAFPVFDGDMREDEVLMTIGPNAPFFSKHMPMKTGDAALFRAGTHAIAVYAKVEYGSDLDPSAVCTTEVGAAVIIQGTRTLPSGVVEPVISVEIRGKQNAMR